MKRSLIIVLLVLLAAVAGFIYFTKDDDTFSRETSIYKAVPLSTPFFFEFNSLKSVPFQNPLIKELMSVQIGNVFFDVAEKVDSIIQNSNGISGNLRSESFILSFGFTGRNELVPLIIKNTGNNKKRKALGNLIHTFYPEGKFTYNERNYSNYKITEISAGSSSVFYSFSEGLFLASSKSLLVEQSIRQLTTQGILKSPYFKRVNKTVTSNSELSLYVNHQIFPDYLKNLLSRQTIRNVNEFGETASTNYQDAADEFKDFSSWTELDFNFEDDYISLGGISAADDSLNHFLSVFDKQEASRFRADDILPKNTSFFCSYTFSNKKEFFKRLEEYFKHSDFYYKREESIKKIELGVRADIKNVFGEIVKDEVIVATTTIPVNPENKTSFFILHTEGKSAAEEQLNLLLSNYAVRKKVAPETLTSTYKVDKELQFNIYKFPYPSFPGIWLGSPFSLNQANYVSFYDNFMIFSNSEKGLQEYLHSMALDATLAKDIRYLEFKQNISNRSNINIFVDVNKAFSFEKEIFSDDISKFLDTRQENLRKFWALNWQVQRNKDIYFNSLILGYNEKGKEEAQTTWQSTIGSTIPFKPQIVINHDDRKNREIILQDNRNSLHQVTKDGRIRWSIQLPEPVLGEIHQIDYYRNGNLQYLFNTKDKLYLLDRNGNNVAHFPVDFRSPATNGISVFDYDNNRNYRYFVACEDKKVYAYDQEAKIISGWIFDKTDFPVTTPVQHFRVGQKDFIVFKDESRIYIQDRRGETRVSTSARFQNSRNPLVLDLNDTPKIVATDITGKVYYLFFDGKFTEKKTGKFSENHFFTCDDLNGNGVPDFIFVDGNELSVFDENGKKLFHEKFDHPITHQPNIYTFGPKSKKIGIVDSAANQIYLINPDGKLHEGFPLQGNSEFSIGSISDNSEQLNLLVGNEGGSLFNYTMN